MTQPHNITAQSEPKPPSLEEKALKELDYIETNDFYLDSNVSIIRLFIATLLSRIEDLERRLDKAESNFVVASTSTPMTDTNPRYLLTEHDELLVKLSDILWNNGFNKAAREADAAVERLHNFLAQTKPQGPTDEEIADEARKYLVNEYTLPAKITYLLDSDNFEYEPTIGCFRAVLARWGK